MASSTWETVGKKKNKGDSQNVPPSKEKELLENMPRIARSDPVQLDDTVYSAFLGKENKKPSNANSKDDVKQNGTKKNANQKKKKPEEHRKKPKLVDLNVALSTLDAKDLEGVLTQSEAYFPNHPTVWLKDLASYLNIKLENTLDNDPIYKGKSHNYPLDAVPNACSKVLHAFMKKFSKQTLDNIFYYGIQTMLQESSKGIPVHGFKIFLQLLSHTKPDIVAENLPQYMELLKMHQNNPSKCLSLLWVFGQCGFKNFNCGLKVWLDLMLPALEVRQVAHYPVDYLEALITSNKKSIKKSYGLVTLREYFQVLDVFFSPKFTLANDLKNRLNLLYPFIKTLAYGETPSQNLRTFFPSYLTRFSNTNSKAMKEELLECLTHCLITDMQSFSVWCQMYTKHLTASSHLLGHIVDNWKTLAAKMDKKILMETMRTFTVTNEELDLQSKGKLEGLKLCQTATKHDDISSPIQDLMMKLSGTSFPWSFLVFLLVSVFAAIVVYDISSSSSFRSSKSMQFLEHYGIISLIDKTYQGVNNVMVLSVQWLKTNFPIFYASVRDTLVPFVITVWKSSKDFLLNAEIESRPYRALMLEKVIQFFHWVYDLSPEFWMKCEDLIWLSWDLWRDYSYRIWLLLLDWAAHTDHWLTEHVFTGSLSKEAIKDTALRGVEHLKNGTSFLVSWAKTYLLATK